MSSCREGTDHPIRKNTVLSLFISGIDYLFPVVVFVYVARILHPEGLGSASFASSFAAYFVLFTGLGMPIYGLRTAAAYRHSPGELSKLTAELLLVRILSGVIAWGIFLVFSRFIPGNHLLMIYGFSILAAIPDCTWLYKGMEDYTSLAWISSAAKIARLIFILLLVRTAEDIQTYAWISVLIPFIGSLIELAAAEHKWNLKIFRQLRTYLFSNQIIQAVRKHLKPLFLFLLMSCAVTIYTHTDAVMLGFMKSEQIVGLYSCAARIKGILPVLTGTLWAAALPKSAELWKQKRTDEFRKLSEKSFHVVYVILIPLVVYYILFSEPWIVLIGGDDYLEAALTMRLLLLAVIPIGFSNIVGGQMLIPTGNEKKLFHAEVVGAAGNIVLNAILIPFLSAPGAAIATVMSETIVTILTIRAIQKITSVRILQIRELLHSLIGCIVAGAISYALSLCVSGIWKVPVSIAAFGIFFAFVLLIFHDSLWMDIVSTGWKLLPTPLRRLPGTIKKEARKTMYQINACLFPGKTNYFCPCCGIRFHSFIDDGYTKHPEIYNPERYQNIDQNVICPVCKSLPRHRILASWFNQNKEPLRGRILYFAPEYGITLWFKRNHISYTTADLFNPADLKLDIQATGLPDESYDIIICNHVLEHVDDFRAALKEMYRILSPGGHFICSFPMDPKIDVLEEGSSSEEEQLRRFGQRDHKRVFGINADCFLTQAGFTVQQISGEKQPEEILPVTGPADYDINCLFDCTKTSDIE